MSKRLRSIVLMTMALMLVVAACSSSDSEETTTTVAAATETTVAAATEETTTSSAQETTTTAGDTTTTAGEAFSPIGVKIGAILPQTGQLAAIIEALEQPIRMAVEEINAVSPGILEVTYSDSGTDPNVASTNVDEYLTGDYNAIVGPASTGVTLGVFDKINESEIVMCSGSNTGAALSASIYDPYYNRTAPSDDIQAPVLGDLILNDGQATVAVVWRADEYGRGFGETLAQYLSDSGADVPYQDGYDFNATSFDDIAASIVNSGAEALAMITFDEGGSILQALQGAGFTGQIYVADGFKDNVSVDTVGGNAALLTGIRGTAPSSAPANGDPGFVERLEAFAPGTPTIFSAHFYDCLVVEVLAAQEAQSSDPKVFVENMVTVTTGGEKCISFDECFALLQEGKDIDYDGASGPLDFGPNGEPTIGTYDLFEYDDAGDPVSFDQSVGTL
jgi:ABC-type branched-subunit amino acid transport system substrate-binding protein